MSIAWKDGRFTDIPACQTLVHTPVLRVAVWTSSFFLQAADNKHPQVAHMMTSSNGNTKVSALLAICAGNSPASGEFPAQRSVTRSFDVSFYPCLNKRLRKQSWGWWFETLSRPLWRIVMHDLDLEMCLWVQNLISINFYHYYAKSRYMGPCYRKTRLYFTRYLWWSR